MVDSRGQFEEWLKQEWPKALTIKYNTGDYRSETVQQSWVAWQAAQASLLALQTNQKAEAEKWRGARMTQPTKQIYLLDQTAPDELLSGTPGFTQSMVVRAACITCARSVAAGAAGAEGTAVWRDSERSTCKEVKQEGINGVVLRSDS